MITGVRANRHTECDRHRYRIRKANPHLASLFEVGVLRGTVALNRKLRQRRTQAQHLPYVRRIRIMEKRSFLDGGRWSHSAT
jgi:hypothetical protein